VHEGNITRFMRQLFISQMSEACGHQNATRDMGPLARQNEGCRDAKAYITTPPRTCCTWREIELSASGRFDKTNRCYEHNQQFRCEWSTAGSSVLTAGRRRP